MCPQTDDREEFLNGYLSTQSHFKVTDGRFETSSNKDSVTIVLLKIGLVFRE